MHFLISAKFSEENFNSDGEAVEVEMEFFTCLINKCFLFASFTLGSLYRIQD